MKYKVTIKSTPHFTTTIKARSTEEAKRIARQQAILSKIRVLYSDEIWIEDVEIE
jgi:hypothetical protein